MSSGIFVTFENPMNLKSKFSKIFSFIHEVEGEAVNGVIQLDEPKPEEKIDDIIILNCELVDYVQIGRNVMKKDKQTNRYSVETNFVLVPTMFRFQIINNNFVKINNAKERPYVIKALTIALGGNKNKAKPVNFNMKKLEEDYPKHKKSNVKRDGLWQGGTIHGINLAKDSILEDEYKEMMKSSITFEVEYFDTKVDVSISKYGGISFKTYGDIEISNNQFIKYFIKELQPYTVIGKVTKHRRTSLEF